MPGPGRVIAGFSKILNFHQLAGAGNPARGDNMQPKSFRDDKRQSTLDDQTTLLEGIIFRIIYLQQIVTGAAFIIIILLLMIFFNQ